MKEQGVFLPTHKRLRIDELSKRHARVFNEGMTGAIFLAEDYQRRLDRKPSLSDEKQRGKFIDLYMRMIQCGIENGMHATEMGVWVHGMFEALNEINNPKPILSIFERTVPAIDGSDL